MPDRSGRHRVPSPSEARRARTTRSDRDALGGQVGERDGAVALGQPLAIGTDDQRDVDVPHGRQAEQALQVDLPRRRGEQVVAAHDDVDALGGVVDHDGEVVRRHAVVAAQHDVVGGAGDRPGTDRRRTSTGSAAARRRSAGGRARRVSPRDLLGEVTARLRVGADGTVRGRRGLEDLPSRAVALVDEACRAQRGDGVLVAVEALALADHGTVPVDADRGQVGELARLVGRRGVGPVEILHPHDETLARRSGRGATRAAPSAGCRRGAARWATERSGRSRSTESHRRSRQSGRGVVSR